MDKDKIFADDFLLVLNGMFKEDREEMEDISNTEKTKSEVTI
jgi:hypothetical protein